MSKPLKRVLIVGGVAGGATCAARLRRLNEHIKITVFEKGEFVSFANCGLPYYVGNVIKKKSDLLLATPTLFKDRFNIDVRVNHQVLKIDRSQKQVHIHDLVRQEKIVESYDYLVLSTGANAVRPNLPGIDLPGIYTVRNIPDTENIKQWIQDHNVKRAVVVGAGFIGLEMTESLQERGIKVDLVEFAPHIMSNFDPEMVTDVEQHIRSKGVGLHLREAVSGFEKTANGLKVLTRSGKSIDTDMAILSIGVKPDTQLAQDAQLALGATGGIKTNERMQTSDPFIYCAGDSVETHDYLTGKPAMVPLANPANRQGRVIADNIADPTTRSVYRGVQGTSICKVFDYVLASTGHSEKRLQPKQYEKVYLFPFNHVTYYPGATKMNLKLLFDPKDGRVLGAQAVGVQGVDKRIDVVSMAIQSKATVFDLEEAELCYSPQFGAGKDPIQVAGMLAANHVRGDQPLVHWDSLKMSEQPQILDVRNQDEFDREHIPGAKLIPLPQLRKRLGELEKTKKVYVHCAVGQRGYYATRILKLEGYDAANLSGGMTIYKSLVAADKMSKL
ncbi:FAD-dependent pyridine nucleotide-disulfide oxidoreductase [Gorgonomyces haynaldii]|nr:FAD-dependent pyridine nucleotide-disulfide oxidoreductase [Gorgonomyces haynaldii]